MSTAELLRMDVADVLSIYVVQRVTKHLECLARAHGLALVGGTAADVAEQRFGAWRKHLARCRVFCELERGSDRWQSQPIIASALGVPMHTVRDAVRALVEFRVAMREANGRVLRIRPFARGAVVHKTRRKLRPDGSLIEGGIRLTMLYQRALSGSEARDVTDSCLANVASEVDSFLGAAAIQAHDAAMTPGERVEASERLRDYLDRRTGPARQLELFADAEAV